MIRPYRAEDLEDVMTVWAAASAVAHPFLSTEFLAMERHTIASIHLLNTETWIWESDGIVVGFISLLGNEIGGIFVDPRSHRAGIGRTLIDHALASRKDLEVEVFKNNVIGRAFYAKCGFELMQEKAHEQTGLEVVRLRLAATTPLPTGEQN